MAYPEALERAMGAALPLRLRMDLAGVRVPATTAFCPRALQPGMPRLWARAPVLAEGRPFPVGPGIPLAASFVLDGRYYAFGTRIDAVRPDPGAGPVWILEAPPALEPLQRRAAFRLSRWADPPLRARLWPIGPGPWSGPALLEALIEDLGAGGIGLVLPARAALGLPPGRVLGLNFRLGPGLPPVVIKGAVRWRRPAEEGPAVRVGVAFTETIRGPDYSGSITLVMRYVTGEERLRIQRERTAP